MNKSISINGVKIGKDYPPYIIAEMSANHNGDINAALKIIENAATAGKHWKYIHRTERVNKFGSNLFV